MNTSTSQTQEFTPDRAFRRRAQVESQRVPAEAPNTQHKRRARQPWLVLGVLLACVQLLAGASGSKHPGATKRKGTRILWMDLDSKFKKAIDVYIETCISDTSIIPVGKEVAKCIDGIRSWLNQLKKEQKHQPYSVSIVNENVRCFTGCCEEMMTHLVHQLGDIEGLHVKELSIESYFLFDKWGIRTQVFIDKPERPVVVANLYARQLSNLCFHSICSVVQVCPPKGSKAGVVRTVEISHIDFTTYPLKWAWVVSKLTFENAEVVNFGASVHRLPRGSNVEGGEGVAAPGLWVEDKVVVASGGNCCLSGRVVSLIEQGVPVEAKVRSLGIEVPENTPDTKLARAVYRAVHAVRKVVVESVTPRHVELYRVEYRNNTSKELWIFARQLNELLEKDAEQPSDLAPVQGVDIKCAPREPPFMYVDIGGSRHHWETVAFLIVRVEKEVLASAEACAAAIAKIKKQSRNVYVLKAATKLEHIEKTLRRGAEVPAEHGMTLFPCECFAEEALNDMWFRGPYGCVFGGHEQYEYCLQVTLSCMADGSVHMNMPRALPMLVPIPSYKTRVGIQGSFGWYSGVPR